MATDTTRMGSESLRRAEPRATYSYAPTAPAQPTFWGGLPSGIKTILKIAVVAGAVYLATPLLLQIPIVGGIVGSIGTAVGSVGTALMTGIESVFVFLGGTPFGAATLSASATSTAALGASGTAAAATALSAMSAKTSIATTAAVSHAPVAVAASTPTVTPDISHATTPVPDVSASQVASIDSSNLLAMKAKTAAMATTAQQNAAAMDMPDLPDMDHGHNHAHDNSKMAKLGHFAYDERQEVLERRRKHVGEVQEKLDAWTKRVGQKPDAASIKAENVRKRDTKFTAEVADERTRFDPTMSPSV